jgi:hypothetical protein
VFEEKYMAQAPAAVVAARAQIVTSALRAIGASLAERTGVRSAIVLVSDGFARIQTGRELPANLQTAVRIANRADAPVYAFAPTPVPPPAATASEPPAEGTAARDETAAAALKTLAAETGGIATLGAQSFDQGLSRMANELDAHYVLSYLATHGRDGRFHALRIAVKRPAVTVRARAGYVAPIPPEMRTSASAPSAPIRMLKRSVLIQSWSGIRPLPDGRARVMITWEPRIRAGIAIPVEPASIHVTATTPTGTILFDERVTAVGTPAKPGATDRASFDAPAGRVLIDMKILDAKGVVLDTDSRDVDIPDLKKTAVTILEPAILPVGSELEFRRVAGDAEAAPTASREFRRTERLLVRVPAYTRDGTPAPLSATLLNRLRQPIRTLERMQTDLPVGLNQFEVRLAPLAPGEYTLRFSTGDVSEFLTFRVRG